MSVATETKVSLEGLNLTASRRAVLDIVKGSKKPMKAYDILSDLQQVIPHAKPPTVYRALDYLVTNHLLHRVNAQNAFVYCQHHEKCFHDHPERFNVIFTCITCGAITEQTHHVMSNVMAEMTKAMGFMSDSHILECTGVCKECS